MVTQNVNRLSSILSIGEDVTLVSQTKNTKFFIKSASSMHAEQTTLENA